MTQNQEIAKYVYDTASGFGEFVNEKIDSLSFFVDIIKKKFGVFDIEIKNLVDLLERLNIIANVKYVEAASLYPHLTGYTYEAEVSIPRLKDFIENGEKKVIPKITKTNKNLLLSNELKPETLTGKLGTYSDGTIRYGNEIIDMRNQLKDLCRLFINHHNRLLTFDNIKEDIIGADRRYLIKNATISKYVSELHKLLKNHFKKNVIFNQKEEGWFFKV